LKWQSTLITKSLVELDANNNKISIQLHKSLLGYMGDKQMAFPATLARDILQKGYELPELRDEIYTLILKQLTGNQRVESIAKGWQMLCMCTGTFPPSVAFADYLLNYILEKEGSKGAIRNYARYCLITLEGMLASGPTGFIPSVEEISAYKERPPILATIELVNGNLISEELPVTPDLNVAKVADICRVFLEISDKRMKNFGIFVYDTEENMNDPKAATQVQDLPRTPRPLSDNEYMGQIFVDRIRQRRTYKFVFKRKIFLPSDQYSTDDYVYRYLNYIQIEDDSLISGNLGVENEEDASKLAAISIIINYLEGDYTEANVIEFLPPAWREIKEENEWQEEVMAICGEIAEKDADELRDEFLAILEKDPFFGAHMFHVQKLSNEGLTGHLPKDLTFAFNSAGLHVLNTETGDKIKTFFFQDIVKWGGSSSTFSLVLVDSDRNEQFELIVTTAQAQDMASIIMDYINAIMESGEF
jgi:hypothetical protein